MSPLCSSLLRLFRPASTTRWRLAGVVGVAAAFLSMAVPARAHGLDVVAQHAAGVVSGLARYSDQSPAANVAVEVFRASGGDALADGVTDPHGRFRFEIGNGSGALRVVVEGEEGHRAEAMVASLSTAPSAAAQPAVATPWSASTQGFATASSVAVDKQSPGADQALQMLSLVREDVARLERQIRFRDIVGGVGYLVGLAGIAAWWLSRRRG